MTSLRHNPRRALTYIALAALIALVCVIFNTPRTVSPVWYAPYLSAAENVAWGGEFLINLDEVEVFTGLPEEERYRYRFTRDDDLQRYSANPLGYAYTVAAAKRLFPWLPDLPAVEALQILLHVVICLIVTALLGSPARRTAFVLLYALNPLVIYFVTNPIYFFYQAIPSLGLVALLLAHRLRSLRAGRGRHLAFAAMCAALGLAFLIRPTMIGAIGAFFLLAWFVYPDRRVVLAGAALAAVVAVSGNSPHQKNFWHTPYVGIGAYPNSHMQGLSDDNGYAMFERKTGRSFNASLGGPYYDDAIMAEYRAATKSEYLRILRTEWPMLLRNMVLNVLSGFSIGYLVGQPYWVQYLIVISGLVFLASLAYARQFLLIGLVVATIAPFALYFPPIQAYMYGAYLLLVIGLIGVLEHVGVIARADRLLRSRRIAERPVGADT